MPKLSKAQLEARDYQRSPKTRPQHVNAATLGRLIRDIGDEVIDPKTGWTRIEAVIRRLFQEALSGKVQSTDLLLERGWGKVPATLDIDMKAEVTHVLEQTGISLEDAFKDPMLKNLLEAAGYVVEGEGRYIEYGANVASGAIPESENGTYSEESFGNGSGEFLNQIRPRPSEMDRGELLRARAEGADSVDALSEGGIEGGDEEG